MRPNSKETLYQYWQQSEIITDEEVLSAFLKIDRENFVRAESVSQAYQDHPLPIGYDQTISQPTTVMMMIQLLEVKKEHKVLEIGAGSGYNAALLSKLADFVYTLECIAELATFAKRNIARSQIRNVAVIHQDGKQGYQTSAPFHRIILTAAAAQIPEQLLAQLGDDGVMVAPVGNPYGCEMFKIHKLGEKITTTRHGMFSFVPLV